MSAEYSVNSLQHLILSQHASTSAEAIAALRAFQERIKADEGAVPVGYTRVDCVETLKQQDFAPMIRLRQRGDYTVPLFTHPPAQAAQVDLTPQQRLDAAREMLAGMDFVVRRKEDDPLRKTPTAEPATQGELDGFDYGLRSRGAAWDAVCHALDLVSPGWIQQAGTGMECAVVAINALAAQPRAVPDGTWLWGKLMDWCKARGYAPATMDDLFAISGEAHKLFSAAPRPGESA